MTAPIAVPSLQAGSIRVPRAKTVECLFRIGIGTCFIGHGVFGVLTKEAWLPYFGLVGIGSETAYRMMPVVGILDIIVGIVGLLSPRRAVVVYMGVWALWTAVLRPLTGESPWEAVERAGNYGVPLAFLLAVGLGSVRGWLSRMHFDGASALVAPSVLAVLRTTTILLLVGHGALAFTGANGIVIRHLAAIGLPAGWAPVVGALEIGLAVAVAVRVNPTLLVVIAGWKLVTEMLFVVAGAPVWEVIERGGSYTAPLLLALLISNGSAQRPPSKKGPSPSGRSHDTGGTRLFSALVLTLVLTTQAAGQQRGRRPEPPRLPGLDAVGATTLLGALRDGGYNLACRHAITDRSGNQRGPLDLNNRSTQRNLSRAGEDQARALGRALAALDIPVGEVYSSPYARTMESAQLAFDRATADRMLYGSHTTAELRARFNRRPRAGNTVLMTHQGLLRSALGYRQPGEGDCIVIRPTPEGPDVLANVTVPQWERLAAMGAARDGGVVLLCRHALTRRMNEVEPVDYDNLSTQRLLSEEGERQARRMGVAFRALGVEVGEIVASPMSRAHRTAELMFGRVGVIDSIWHTNGSDYGGPPLTERPRVLSTPVPVGNRVIVSHIGTMRSALSGMPGEVGEGDCVIVRPDGEGFTVIGVVPWNAWIEAAGN